MERMVRAGPAVNVVLPFSVRPQFFGRGFGGGGDERRTGRSTCCARLVGRTSTSVRCAEGGELTPDDKRGSSRVSRVSRVAKGMREEQFGSRSSSRSSFAKPLSALYPPRTCRFCGGAGEVVCEICDGQGKFPKGGYHRKNPVSMERIIGSKWTAMESTFGWRHFRVRSKRRVSGKDWFVEMSATCDEATRFWVNLQNLKDRERWSMGWLQKAEILDAHMSMGSILVCKACKGGGRKSCACSLREPGDITVDIIRV